MVRSDFQIFSHAISALLIHGLASSVSFAEDAIAPMQQSPLVVKSQWELIAAWHELAGNDFGVITSKPGPDSPQRLYFASIGTPVDSKRRILVYEKIGDAFHRLDDFVNDEDKNGGVYQAERDGDVLKYYNGKPRQFKFERKIQVVRP